MTMDLITGLAVTSSVFMLACAIVAVVVSRTIPDSYALASRILATVVVVFFIVFADLVLIAQQVSLALGTFVIGILVVVLLYLEPSVRAGKREVPEVQGTSKEDWRR